ncbi:MAG: hypothetical protein SFY32_06985 [Bacteroidota bacterium]|nr:hypothetical protein [Bacteroidota bacterium]
MGDVYTPTYYDYYWYMGNTFNHHNHMDKKHTSSSFFWSFDAMAYDYIQIILSQYF